MENIYKTTDGYICIAYEYPSARGKMVRHEILAYSGKVAVDTIKKIFDLNYNLVDIRIVEE